MDKFGEHRGQRSDEFTKSVEQLWQREEQQYDQRDDGSEGTDGPERRTAAS